MLILSVFFILIALAVSPLYENGDIDLLFEKSSESANNSEFNEALSYLDEILKLEPDNALALNNKGGILIYLEKYDEALPYFERAIEINLDFAEAINNKAAALYHLNRNADALATFYEAYKIDPHDLVTLENMASIVAETDAWVKEVGYAKIEVRTFDDQLVGYTESHNVWFQDPLALMFLEDKADWKSIEIDGEELEVLEYSVNIPVSKSGLATTTKLALIEEGAVGVNVIKMTHDGFLVNADDELNVKIILLRNN